MSALFEPTRIKSLEMPNRFVRSATWMAMAAEDGTCTPLQTETYAHLAAGDIGLIISGFFFVSPEGKGPPGMSGLYSDDVAASFRGLVDAVHAAGGRIAAQIAHCGVRSNPLPGHGPALGPMQVLKENGDVAVRKMAPDEIARIIADFAAAAERAKRLDFDAVQLHFAHGYLGSQFLSPYYNRRDDAYGGPLENRIRFLLEVYAEVRDAVGDGFPVMAKLNSQDFVDGGLPLEEGVRAAVALDEVGLDLVEVSGGTADSRRLGPARAVKSAEDENYLRQNALAVKAAVTMPVATVGGVRQLASARRLIEDDGLDYVALSRPFLREPHLVIRWKAGDEEPVECISCSRCFRTHLKGRGIFCAQCRDQEKPGK